MADIFTKKVKASNKEMVMSKIQFSLGALNARSRPPILEYSIEESLDARCRHYVLEGVRAQDGGRVPADFDAWVVDAGEREEVIFVRLCPMAAALPAMVYSNRMQLASASHFHAVSLAVQEYLERHADGLARLGGGPSRPVRVRRRRGAAGARAGEVMK